MNASADTFSPQLGTLANLKVTDVRLDAVTLPYFNGQEVVVVPLDFSARGVLSEEYFGYLFEVVGSVAAGSRTNSRPCCFKLDGKVRHKSGSLRDWTTIFFRKCLMCRIWSVVSE